MDNIYLSIGYMRNLNYTSKITALSVTDLEYYCKIRSMSYLERKILDHFKVTIDRGKSVLLLGPRQVGKTTLVRQKLQPDIQFSFAKLETKQRYEKDPAQFEKDLTYQIQQAALTKKMPLVFVDEVQKIPAVMDAVQYLIDNKQAQFILSGSSARKLKHGSQVNLLPGRVVIVNMTPLIYSELPQQSRDLDDLLDFGSLPGIILQERQYQQLDLNDYVMTYLEEEIRQEALVRNVAAFSQFLELAAIESGRMVNYTRLAQDVGVSDQTIKEYFQILVDCLVAYKIKPITKSFNRRILLKAPKFLLFDLGVRRLAANEGQRVSIREKAHRFEQYVGVELQRMIYIYQPLFELCYWRDRGGAEIDYVIDAQDYYIPVEVKWNDQPKEKDARHLSKFIEEYECQQGYIICRTPTAYKLTEKITVLPWQNLEQVIRG